MIGKARLGVNLTPGRASFRFFDLRDSGLFLVSLVPYPRPFDCLRRTFCLCMQGRFSEGLQANSEGRSPKNRRRQKIYSVLRLMMPLLGSIPALRTRGPSVH
jgi:hypothetical protein